MIEDSTHRREHQRRRRPPPRPSPPPPSPHPNAPTRTPPIGRPRSSRSPGRAGTPGSPPARSRTPPRRSTPRTKGTAGSTGRPRVRSPAPRRTRPRRAPGSRWPRSARARGDGRGSAVPGPGRSNTVPKYRAVDGVARATGCVRLHDAGHEQPDVRERDRDQEHPPPAAEHGPGAHRRRAFARRRCPRPHPARRPRERREDEREHDRLPRGQRDADPAAHERPELDRLVEPHEERDEHHGRRVAERDPRAAQPSNARPFAERRGTPGPEQQPHRERRHREQGDAELDGRRAAGGKVRAGQARRVDGEIALEHQRHVVERTQVERPDPERAHERDVRDRERERRHGREDADPRDQQEDQEPPKDRRSPSGVLVGDRRAPTRRRHDRAARTSSATSVGVRPTRTPAASSASALAAAVPLEPVMIAPAWPIRLPGGAVKPAM